MLSQKYPAQIKYIVGNEAAERYSYYGMRSILILFMTQYLLISKENSVSYYHLFAGACYLLPLLGAYLSDRFLGKYQTIMSLSLVYCLGHAVLALFESKTGLYWGLGLIALGAGGIKPCVSAHVGDQFKKSEQDKLRSIYDLFYWMINFGSTFASLITPWTYQVYGPKVAFGIPGLLMALATFVFWMGRRFYVHVPPSGPNPNSVSKVLWTGIKNYNPSAGFWAGARKRFDQEHVDGAAAVISIFVLFAWISVFWALFDQSGSTWTLQAQKMDLSVGGWFTLNEAQIQAINPVLVLILIPIFSKWIYPSLERKGFKVTPLRKMGVGMFIAALSFVAVAVCEIFIDQGLKISVGWQFVPYFLITVAEILISITGLEFAYTQAPRSVKSTIMSLWLLTVFFGNMITAYLAKANTFAEGTAGFFFVFAGLMAAVGVAFVWVAKSYKERNFMETSSSPNYEPVGIELQTKLTVEP